jgi:hypothetical protein
VKGNRIPFVGSNEDAAKLRSDKIHGIVRRKRQGFNQTRKTRRFRRAFAGIMKILTAEILKTRSELTVIGGEILFDMMKN